MRRITGTAALLLLSAAACAADLTALSSDCEAALALSAAPAHLRDSAGVYILGRQGYEQIRPSQNGYRCIVERNHARSIIPQCFDEASRDANLAVILDEGRLLREGMTFQQLAERRREKLAANAYPPASRAGVVYMVSDYNYIYVSEPDRMLKVAPHVMFHAPGLDNEDIGADPAAAFANPGLPFINAAGPHGFMVSFTRSASDSADVRRHCDGQLPPVEELTPFPPTAD